MFIKFFLQMVMIGFALNAGAQTTNVVNDYKDISSVACVDSAQSYRLVVDMSQKIIEGFIGDLQNGEFDLTNDFRSMGVENDLVEGLEQDVEIITNFMDSGLNVLSGLVLAKDQKSFGTLGLVLDKPLDKSLQQPMVAFYLEAMTGRTVQLNMQCTFTLK